MRLLPLTFALGLAACLGSSPDSGDAGGRNDTATDGGDGSAAREGGVPAPVDMAVGDGGGGGSIDLAGSDLTGLTNCFGATACDPAQMFCIIYHDGSQAAPGTVAGGPACYEPADTCANQGQPMNCACIQADANLGSACQGGCVDHMDGTYDCYKT